MTLDYFEEQLTSEETNLRIDFELEIMLPAQAKSNRRGSDQCNLSLLSIFHLSDAHSRFSLFSLGWGGLIFELHHI